MSVINGPIFGPLDVPRIIWYSILKKSFGWTSFDFAIWYMVFWISSGSSSSCNAVTNIYNAFLDVSSKLTSVFSCSSNSSE